MMNYEIFKEVVKEKFMDYMPDNFKGMELVVMPVEKVNMTYDGISIRGKDTNISPTIYINDMYEKYQSCGDLEETLMAACDLMAMEFAKTPQELRAHLKAGYTDHFQGFLPVREAHSHKALILHRQFPCYWRLSTESAPVELP